jgi:hypothetical protein
MSGKLFRITTVVSFFILASVPALSQHLVCKRAALAAQRPIPELKYDCNEDLTESDDAVLTQPNRRQALDLYAAALEKLTSAEWWKTSVEDLNLCDFRKKAGPLTKEEKDEFQGGNYYFKLRGNNQFRVVVVPDPCYQPGFNGANIFLLNRAGGRVFAAEIIDGFYTRADFPLGFDYARNGRETIIQIATTSGGLYPTETFYYFTIDKKTNCAVPKNLFKDNGRLTNRIYSAMLLGEPEEYGLPPKAESLRIIKNRRLTKRFYVFEDIGETFGEDNHQKFHRVVFKWNGKFYE